MLPLLGNEEGRSLRLKNSEQEGVQRIEAVFWGMELIIGVILSCFQGNRVSLLNFFRMLGQIILNKEGSPGFFGTSELAFFTFKLVPEKVIAAKNYAGEN